VEFSRKIARRARWGRQTSLAYGELRLAKPATRQREVCPAMLLRLSKWARTGIAEASPRASIVLASRNLPREWAKPFDCSSRFGELGQVGIGALPEVQEAFVLLQSGLLVS
jgi:hypothetical protein